MHPPGSGSMDPQDTNPAPTAKLLVPIGGYATRQVAGRGRKRFDDNDDVLNYKFPRLSEHAYHPPPLRLEWNDEPEIDSESLKVPPHIRITQPEQSLRVIKSIPGTSKRGGNVERGTVRRFDPMEENPPVNSSSDRLVQPGQASDGVPPAGGIYRPSSEHLPPARREEMQQSPSPQHRELLQKLLQQPSQPQPQPREPSPLPQTHLQLQQNLHGPSRYQQEEQEQSPPDRQQQQPQPLHPSSSSSSPYDRQQQPRQDALSQYEHTQRQPHPHVMQQPQSLPPPSSSPYDHRLPLGQVVPTQYQFNQHHQPYSQVTHQPAPSQHRSQHQQRIHALIQGPSEIHRTPQVVADAPQVLVSGDEQMPQGNITAYESLLIQLIQSVGFRSTGRMMTQQEAVESWNQLDVGQKYNLHNNVCIALAQIRGRPDGVSNSAVPTSQATAIPVDAHQLTEPDRRSDEELSSLHDRDITSQGAHTVAEEGTELSMAPEASTPGFGFEEMERNHVVSMHQNELDFDAEMAAQDSNHTIRPAESGEEDIVMKNAGKSDDAHVDEDYPSGVDGFGFAVNDPENDGLNANEMTNSAVAVASRNAGVPTGRASDPLLLVLIGKFGTLVDAVNRQTDAIQSMESYVEESRKILAQVVPTGNVTQGSSNPATNNDAIQNAVPPGIAKKIQYRVAQITGKVVERIPGEADQASLKLLKERVRSHVLTLLGVTSLDLLAARCRPFTEAEVDGYLADDGSVECSPHSFRIDFQRQWKRFCINKEAREVFIENFLDVMMGSGMTEDQSIPEHLLHRDIVGQILDAYVTGTLRKKYKELIQLAPQPRDGEDDDEAKQRVQAAQKKHDEALRKAARVSRKTTTFVARNVVITVTPSFQRHSVLFARLTASNMSEDESDGPRKAVPRKFRIIVAEWQSNELREFLWELDRQYRADWDKTPKSKRRPGNTPRDRKLKPDSRSEPGVAPQGLWKNCYNPGWLSKLTRYDHKCLRIIDSDYDFSNLAQNAQPTACSSRADPST